MLKTASCGDSICFVSKAQLLKLKLKAKRAGVWFKVLPRIDRALLDLTIMVADSIRSSVLVRSILAVARKLEGVLESSILCTFQKVAVRLAQKLSLIAQKWGNESAKNWSFEVSFIKFLAVMHINQPRHLKYS